MYKPQVNAIVICTDVVNMNLITVLTITQIITDLNSRKPHKYDHPESANLHN